MTPIKTTIISALVAKLQTITIANGYDFEVGTRVYLESEVQENLPTPSIVVVEADESVEFIHTEGLQSTLLIGIGMINGTRRGSTVNETAANMIASIQKAMGPETSITLPMAGGDMACPIQHSEVGNGWSSDGQSVVVDVEFQLVYTRDPEDPELAS